MSVNGCMSLRVSPETDWRPVQGVPRILPYGMNHRATPLHNPEKDKWKSMDLLTLIPSLVPGTATGPQ